MDFQRLIHCDGSNSTYIKHLELLVAALERMLEVRGSQRFANPRKKCDVCQNPQQYLQGGLNHSVGSATESHALRISHISHDNADGDNLEIEQYQPLGNEYTSAALSQSAIRQHGDGGILKIKQYQPPGHKDTPATPSQSAKTQENVFIRFASTVSSLPHSERWKELAPTGEVNRREVFRRLISGLAPSRSKSSKPKTPYCPPEISILNNYSESMQYTATEEYQTTEQGYLTKNGPFECFRELVYCSLCAVALKLKLGAKKDVFNAMASVFGSDAKERRYKQLIRGAKWANKTIYLLSCTKWGACSWDVIYVANHKVNFYSKLNDFSIECSRFIETLTKKEFFTKDPPVISVPFAIPSIVQAIYQDRVSLDRICECLGYDISEYNKLDLSGLNNLLPKSASSGSTDHEPTDPDATKKRKTSSSETSPKRRRLNTPTDSSGEGCEEILCSALESPSDSEIDGLFEEGPTSWSNRSESPFVTSTFESNGEVRDIAISDTYCSSPTSNHSLPPSPQGISTQPPINPTYWPQVNTLPGTTVSRDIRSRASSTVSLVEVESEDGGDQPPTVIIPSGINQTPTFDSEMSSNTTTSFSSTDALGQRFSLDTTAQQQGLNLKSCNLQGNSCYIDAEAVHTYSKGDLQVPWTDTVLNVPDPLPPTQEQLFDWNDGAFLPRIQANPVPNNPGLSLPSTLEELFDWNDGAFLPRIQANPVPNNPGLSSPSTLEELFDWNDGAFLPRIQANPVPNNPGLSSPSTLEELFDWNDGAFLPCIQANPVPNNPGLSSPSTLEDLFDCDFEGFLQHIQTCPLPNDPRDFEAFLSRFQCFRRNSRTIHQTPATSFPVPQYYSSTRMMPVM